METKLFQLMQQKKFVPAVNVLKEELIAGNVIDPRFNSIWASFADKILAAANPEHDLHFELSYWYNWLNFFLNIIEPKWGQAHKGHINFRLGFSHAQSDEKLAIINFKLALKENEIYSIQYLGYKGDQIKEYCREQSSYVALCLLERMDLLEFQNNEERRTFISQIFSEAFDRAIQNTFPDPLELLNSIQTLITDSATLDHCKQVYQELHTVSGARLTYATVSSAGSILETILYDALQGIEICDKQGNVIKRPTLGVLFKVASEHNVFPNDKIKASCRLISYLRNRIHSKNTLRAEYPLTPRASLTIKTLLELSIIEWANINRQIKT